MLHLRHEPELIYGTTWTRYLTRIWNLRITYPDQDILTFDDDVKSAFRQVKYNPQVASVFAFIISAFLFIPTGGTFGAVSSPSNFDPIARARSFFRRAIF